jgi:hypothetical protein
VVKLRCVGDGGIRQVGPVRLSTRRRTPLPVPSAFAGFRFPAEVIVVAVCWYLRYNPARFTRHAPGARSRDARAGWRPVGGCGGRDGHGGGGGGVG